MENHQTYPYRVGYTTGVFDLFHIGHLNLLRNAKSMCDKLIVGVTTEELLSSYKGKKPVIPFVERCEIVRAINCVDVVIPQHDMDKLKAWKMLKFDVVFVGDDWFDSQKWKAIEADFDEVGVNVVYFPYTQTTSSTIINSVLQSRRDSVD